MLADNLKQVQAHIAEALAARKDKNLVTGDSVTLVAVTKNHPPEIITDIEALGITNVGENRVQEAKHKQEAFGHPFSLPFLFPFPPPPSLPSVSLFSFLSFL